MNNNLEKIVEITQKAISESGKPFEQVDKGTVISYLKAKGAGQYSELIYQRLSELNSKTVKVVDTRAVNRVTESQTPVKPEQHSEIKTKQPRKSVFGEVKRLA